MSKAVWGGLVVFASSVLASMGFVEYSQTVVNIGIALGIIGVRVAQK